MNLFNDLENIIFFENQNHPNHFAKSEKTGSFFFEIFSPFFSKVYIMKIFWIIFFYGRKIFGLRFFIVAGRKKKAKSSIKRSSPFCASVHFNMKSQTAIILILVFVTLSVTNGAHLYANAGLLLKLFGLFPYNNNYNSVVVIYGEHSVWKSLKMSHPKLRAKLTTKSSSICLNPRHTQI